MSQPEQQEGFVLWLTGIPSAGKSAIADELAYELGERGFDILYLDENQLSKEPPASLDAEHTLIAQNIPALAQHSGAGGVCVAAFTSPTQAMRDAVRQQTTRCLEIFLDLPLSIARTRDVKGHLAEVASGQRPYLGGITQPYEPPQRPSIAIRTDLRTVMECSGYILGTLEDMGYIPLFELP